jgi:hypothetical protein
MEGVRQGQAKEGNDEEQREASNMQNQALEHFSRNLQLAFAPGAPLYGIPPAASVAPTPPAASVAALPQNVSGPFSIATAPGTSLASPSPAPRGFHQGANAAAATSLQYSGIALPPLPALQAAIHTTLAYLQGGQGQGQVLVQPNYSGLQQLFHAPAAAAPQEGAVAQAGVVSYSSTASSATTPVPIDNTNGTTNGTAFTKKSSTPATKTRPSGRAPIPMYLDYDDEVLTRYQCLLRKQIELFEAGPDDVRGSAQGRNTPINLGQVGIRCRHCASLTKNARARGAVYYSKTIDGIYQVAQNMSKLHLQKHCNLVDAYTRAELAKLHQVRNRASGGKEYWSECLRVMGVCEDKTCLRFRKISEVEASAK